MAFKLKFGSLYQRMPASPGDYGIEGWTTDGMAFQCYCPEKSYTQDELRVAIQSKITRDVPKLKLYQAQIASRIGATKIQKWLLVTPVFDHNNLHEHARKKAKRELGGFRFFTMISRFLYRTQGITLPSSNNVVAPKDTRCKWVRL